MKEQILDSVMFLNFSGEKGWIGLSDIEEEGNFSWTDGSTGEICQCGSLSLSENSSTNLIVIMYVHFS